MVEPSLGLGILKAKLQEAGMQCTVRHFNIFLLKYLQSGTYIALANAYVLNEFLFTGIFEEGLTPVQEERLWKKLEELVENPLLQESGYKTKEDLYDLVLTLRNRIIPDYLRECLTDIYASKATMVGLTCMFDQTIGSLALAWLVKKYFPEKFIVLGGYALEGPVGDQLIRSFDFVDCVNYGEGEEVIASLARASVDRSLLPSIPGILYRDAAGQVARTVKKTPIDMNGSPPPDYDDFVNDLSELAQFEKVAISWETVPVETSRGCWWGQKKHCVFCGIDDETMRYRKRDEQNTFDMLLYLKDKYSKTKFRISDYILPFNYYTSLLPRLEKLDEKLDLSCEIKANVTSEHFRLLKACGFSEVQPGIESFSTAVLKKMDKGVTAIQNIFTLLLGLQFGVEVHYNFLFGFPDDELSDYEEMAKIIPLIYHLIPPISTTPIAITRFAPLQVNPGRFHIGPEIKYDPLYDLIFSESFTARHGFDFNNYCYYFERPYTNSRELELVYRIILRQMDHWKKIHRERKVKLCYSISNSTITFTDTRYDNEPKITRYDGDHALFYRRCEHSIVYYPDIEKELLAVMSREKMDQVLSDFLSEGFMYREEHKLITLAPHESVYEESVPGEEHLKWASPYIAS